MPKYDVKNVQRVEEDIENRIALMRSLQNLADLTADAAEVSNQDHLEDLHSEDLHVQLLHILIKVFQGAC